MPTLEQVLECVDAARDSSGCWADVAKAQKLLTALFARPAPEACGESIDWPTSEGLWMRVGNVWYAQEYGTKRDGCPLLEVRRVDRSEWLNDSYPDMHGKWRPFAIPAASAASEQKCKYCGSDMPVSSQSYLENPFCSGCINERLAKAAAGMPPTKWVREGNYIRLEPADSAASEDQAKADKVACEVYGCTPENWQRFKADAAKVAASEPTISKAAIIPPEYIRAGERLLAEKAAEGSLRNFGVAPRVVESDVIAPGEYVFHSQTGGVEYVTIIQPRETYAAGIARVEGMRP